MCVFSRWEAGGYAEEHSAYCCYADGRTLSVARVSFKDGVIVGETTEPIPLPGFQGCDNFNALRLLAHLLQSDDHDLSDLISAPAALPTTVEGKSFISNAHNVWFLGEFLGFGGFGIVHSELIHGDRYTNVVIKTIENSSSYSTLSIEHKALLKLNKAGGRSLFPVVIDALLKENIGIVALKLSPRGLTVSSFLRATANDRNVIKMLIKSMCPKIINALEVAHTVNLSHCDIRDSNILIIPPERYMNDIIDSIDDTTATHDKYLSLPLDACGFVLNDWGNAVNLNTDNKRDRIKSDLEMVILTIMRLGGCIDLGHEGSMKKPRQPVPRRSTDGIPMTINDISSHLSCLAAKSEYKALACELVNMFS